MTIIIGPVDPRQKLVKSCPNSCSPPMVLQIVPQNLKHRESAWARCLICGLLWEVTWQGIIIRKGQWAERLEVVKEGK